MKEAATAVVGRSGGVGGVRSETTAVVGRSGGVGGVRSESEKEKTKLRERQRRAITTKIFHGLRKWGGYHLSARADINEVLRELAKEAGWIVEPDGTTYRAKVVPGSPCPTCGGAVAAPTTSSSIVIGNGGGGDCSTSTSPRHVSLGGGEPMINNNMTAYLPANNGGFTDIPLALYIYGAGGLPNNGPNSTTATSTSSTVYGGGPVAQQPFYLQEARASNQNTPAGSPLHRPT